MILVYIPCPNQKEAEKIAKELLKKRLTACANIFPISSLYWWKGRIEKAKELVILAKSEDKKFPEIQKEVKKLHSYAVPFIGSFKVNKINKDYLNWLKRETK